MQLYGYAAQNPLRYTDPDGKSFGDFIIGAGNAMSNNATLGGIPRQQGNLDLRLGQAAGDIISIIVGVDEMGAGGGLMGGGALATSTGVLAAPGLAAVAGGAAVAAHGAGVTANAAKNLGVALSEALDELSGGGGNEKKGQTKPQVGTCPLCGGETSNKPGKIANDHNLTPKGTKEIIHDLKRDAKVTGNPDVEVCKNCGEVFPQTPRGGLGDSIGNIGGGN